MKEMINFTHAIHNSYCQLCNHRRDLLQRMADVPRSRENINFCEDEDIRIRRLVD